MKKTLASLGLSLAAMSSTQGFCSEESKNVDLFFEVDPIYFSESKLGTVPTSTQTYNQILKSSRDEIQKEFDNSEETYNKKLESAQLNGTDMPDEIEKATVYAFYDMYDNEKSAVEVYANSYEEPARTKVLENLQKDWKAFTNDSNDGSFSFPATVDSGYGYTDREAHHFHYKLEYFSKFGTESKVDPLKELTNNVTFTKNVVVIPYCFKDQILEIGHGLMLQEDETYSFPSKKTLNNYFGGRASKSDSVEQIVSAGLTEMSHESWSDLPKNLILTGLQTHGRITFIYFEVNSKEWDNWKVNAAKNFLNRGHDGYGSLYEPVTVNFMVKDHAKGKYVKASKKNGNKKEKLLAVRPVGHVDGPMVVSEFSLEGPEKTPTIKTTNGYIHRFNGDTNELVLSMLSRVVKKGSYFAKMSK